MDRNLEVSKHDGWLRWRIVTASTGSADLKIDTGAGVLHLAGVPAKEAVSAKGDAPQKMASLAVDMVNLIAEIDGTDPMGNKTDIISP